MTSRSRSTRLVALLILCMASAGLLAQTVVKPPKNRFTPEQDVKLGLEAAAEVRQQYPIIKDERINAYLPDSVIDSSPWRRRISTIRSSGIPLPR